MLKPGTHVHLIGIGGSGLSAIAILLLEMGYTVSGSDRQVSPLAQRAQAAGAQVFEGHRAENVQDADLVVRSSAVPDDNVEVQSALSAGIPVLKRADFLGELMVDRRGIAVAGTHGKTTTTAMIAWILSALEQDPSFIIGGTSTNLGTNARAGQGPDFVIEADEYDRMFLGLNPQIAVVTNVEHDHPDCYPTPQDFYQAFVDFIDRLPENGLLLACGDDVGAARLMQEAVMKGRRVLSYGIQNSRHAYQARNLKSNASGGFSFDLISYRPQTQPLSGVTPGARPAMVMAEQAVRVQLQVPGQHNVENAIAALAVAHRLQLPLKEAAKALQSFKGTGRRFEVRGEVDDILIVDDYAHHPTEIRATLAAARARYPQREIWTVWQPHTYSRTRTLFDEYATSFRDTDHLLVTEIYAAREAAPEDGFSGRQVAQAIRRSQVHFTPRLSDARELLVNRLSSGSLVIILSAGDADRIGTEVLQVLQEREKYGQK